MAISLRTRRILWVSAGGCCSICRVLLVTEGSETDDPSVFGEEAHIVSAAPGPKYPIPKALKLCITGTQLWDNMEGVRAFYPSWPDGRSEEQHDLIASFLDDLRDWMDVTSLEDSYKARRDAAKHLGKHVMALAEQGLLIGVMQRHMLLTGGIKADPWPWRVLDIELQPVRLARLADESGTPLFPDTEYESAYADLDAASASVAPPES